MKREEIQIRDPFVLVENGIYYLIGTTGSDPWGEGSDLQLFVSRDLEEFEKRGVLVTLHIKISGRPSCTNTAENTI